ncbi:MAG: acyl-CoA dehydrogenase [Leucobacter sp.]|nr:acyl-CoA dehydrogenase [Leucobacter sp.]
MANDPLAPLVAQEAGSYVPPVGEYAFLLGEAFGTDLVARSTEGALTTDDALDAITAAGEFASEVFAPLNTVGDQVGAQFADGEVRLPEGFQEAYKSFVEAGWLSAAASEDAGGDGLPTTVTAALSEFWNGANMAFALCPGLSLGAIRALTANGSQELRDRYLPKMVSGEWTGTMNLTEPQAGTDLAAVRTLARDNGDGSWALTGQKIFITWGDHDVAENIVHLVLARTENAPEGHRGISLFLVPKYLPTPDGAPGERNSVVTVGIEHKLGIHGSPTCVLQFDGATGYLVGELHQGLMGMFVMMNEARFGMGVQGLGLSQRAFQRANDYAHFRVQGSVMGLPEGTPIASHPDVRRLLLSMSSRISALRAMVVYAADLQDRADDAESTALAEFFTPLLKSWGTEESVQITSDAIQVHGGMGFIEETGAAQHFRDSRITPIYEGTTAIQSNDLVGRKVLRDGGKTAGQLLAAMQAQLAELQSLEHPVAKATAERMQRAILAATRATESIAAHAADNQRDVFAVSVPYQELLSLLVGGWMHAIIAAATLKHESLSDDDQRRLTEADFFGAHHLAKVHALAETVAAGEIA